MRVEGGDVSAGLWGCRAQGSGAEGYTTFAGSTNLSHKRYDATSSLAHDLPAGLAAGFRHVVITYDGSGTQWYLDGAPGTAPQMTPITWSPQSAPFELASGGFAATDVIVVDEVAVYDEVLGPERIEAHYECGANGQCD